MRKSLAKSSATFPQFHSRYYWTKQRNRNKNKNKNKKTNKEGDDPHAA